MTENEPEELVQEAEPQIEDETEQDETVAPVQYEMTSFGSDFDAEGLVKRLQRDDVFVPPFQRGYVWTRREASRFIESLLLGLPVPGIFLARESESKRLLVIDGQQRLKTLQFFFDGTFNPDPEAESTRVFKLIGVQPQFEGKTYDTLSEADRIILNDSIIHATIVKQDSPRDEHTSIYHIFERLNTSGRKLSSQQVRVAIYHGRFMDMLRTLNDREPWRAVFGPKSKTLKDQELILRFLALHYCGQDYKRPMKEFLNEFTESATTTGTPDVDECSNLFDSTISFARQAIGDRAFRPERALNAAVFDSFMVALADRLARQPSPKPQAVRTRYEKLLSDERYTALISQSTSDEKNVAERLKLARSLVESA